jgi:hypothetical protein
LLVIERLMADVGKLGRNERRTFALVRLASATGLHRAASREAEDRRMSDGEIFGLVAR